MREQAGGAPRIRLLVVTYGFPWPLTEGAKIRDYHLLRGMARYADIVVLSFCKDDREPPDPRALDEFCTRTEIYVPPEHS